MCNQAEDEMSITHAHDFTDDIDVHYGSGVFNKVMCSIAQNTDIFQTFQIFSHANRFYWHPSTNFTDGACGVLKATYDLGYDTDMVGKAFESVGVKLCSLDNYMRTIYSDSVIRNLSAEKGKRIKFKVVIRKQITKTLKITTSGGSGDVDIYIGSKQGASKSIMQSEESGNFELLQLPLMVLQRGYLLLKPKKGLSFSGVKLRIRVL